MSEERGTSQEGGWRKLADRVRGAVDIPPARRRLFLRLGVAALLLTVFVLVPGYLGVQPGFLERYENLAAGVQTWETSVHAKVDCQSCHVSPGLGSRARYSLRMLGEFYVSWVLPSREPDVLDRPANEACSSCHIDLRTVSPSGDLLIPHRAHVEILGLDCVACHEFLVHELSPEGKRTPRMSRCLECHDGEQAEAACTTCHTEKAAPENHQSSDWLVSHPDRQGEIDCADCHAWTDDWCVECHTRKPSSHAVRWRSNHRFKVEDRRNCEACHEGEFCVRCHGEVPTLNFDPALALVE